MRTIVSLALVLLSGLWASMTRAEESLGVLQMSGGLICDKPESVIIYIESSAQVVPADCGRLNAPLLAEVILTDTHQFGELTFALARYEFVEPTQWGVDTQYGYWGNPVGAPAPQGELM